MIVALTPETAVPIFELRDGLSIFQNLTSPFAWTGHFRGSPAKWRPADGDVVVAAVLEAERNSVVRPFDANKLARKPPILRTKFGPVTVPGADQRLLPELDEVNDDEPTERTETPVRVDADTTTVPAAPTSEASVSRAVEVPKEPSLHTETQWLLLKLGNDMGLDVWVARNDRSRGVTDHRFADLPRIRAELPRQFDPVTNRTIELIDVLWLKGNAIVAAFEIECTTSIYSGLLRMSDLITMQPNLNIPLYLVAPDDRRGKVMDEVNRPTFSRFSPPLRQVCRFLSISALSEGVSQVGGFVRHLKPDFIADLSESCEIEEL